MEQEENEFRKISLNASLVNDIEHYVQKTKSYKSIAEFINEAIRLRLEDLKLKLGKEA